PKCDRVTQRLDRWDAVLPIRPRRAAQQVGGAWLQAKRETFPFPVPFTPKPEGAARVKRYPSHFVKDSAVAVPAYRCSRRIFRHHSLHDLISRQSERHGRPVANWLKEFRDRFDVLKFSDIEIVTKAERNDTPVAQKAVKLELLELKRTELLKQAGFLLRIQKIRLIHETLG